MYMWRETAEVGSSMKSVRRAVLTVLVFGWVLAAADAPVPGGVPEGLVNRISDPLVRVLAVKGVLATEDVVELLAVDAASQRGRLAAMLVRKGILTEADLRDT